MSELAGRLAFVSERNKRAGLNFALLIKLKEVISKQSSIRASIAKKTSRIDYRTCFSIRDLRVSTKSLSYFYEASSIISVDVAGFN